MTPISDDRVRIVLADDVAAYRLLVRVVLETDGRFEVVAEAGDGAEAIRAVEEHRPDAIVLDLAMPVLDGLQAIPEILARSPGTRIVVHSGFVREALKQGVLENGASAYVEKGVEVMTLADTLAELTVRVA